MKQDISTELKTSLKPKPGRILVIEDAFRYEGRIVIPDKIQRRPTTGVIAKLGTGVSVEDYPIGERIVYGLYSGTVINIRGDNHVYRSLLPEDVLCGIEEGENIEIEGVGT